MIEVAGDVLEGVSETYHSDTLIQSLSHNSLFSFFLRNGEAVGLNTFFFASYGFRCSSSVLGHPI